MSETRISSDEKDDAEETVSEQLKRAVKGMEGVSAGLGEVVTL